MIPGNLTQTEYANLTPEEYIKYALEEDPAGKYCSYCGKLNDCADDCGWWYLELSSLNEASGYACQSCLLGKPGQLHIQIYGLGER